MHYCAAHHYDPARAKGVDFDPFWEFVAGPAHAGTFAPPPLDATFGPEVRYSGPKVASSGGGANVPACAGPATNSQKGSKSMPFARAGS